MFACRLHNGSGKASTAAVQHVSEAETADWRHRGGRELDAHAGGCCAIPTNTMMCRSATGFSSGSSRWLTNGSRSVQRSAAGRSPSTSAIERRGRHRSSRRATADTQQPQPKVVAAALLGGTSRSVSPPTIRHGSKPRSKRTEHHHADIDNDDDDDRVAEANATKARQCRGCQNHMCAGGRPTGNGSTMPVDRRKIHRHHQCAEDVVDGAATMTSAIGGGHRGQWATMCPAIVDGSRCATEESQPNGRFRQPRATPAVTPISPSTPADDIILASPTGMSSLSLTYVTEKLTCVKRVSV